MRSVNLRACAISLRSAIPLFAGKPSHPFVPLDDRSAGARSGGQAASDPVRLIVPMLERFMATDRGFAKERKGRKLPA